MHVISRKRLRDFWNRQPDAERPLAAWAKLMEKGHYGNFADLRAHFPGVDRVGRLHVFNIGGNKYRLVAAVLFDLQRVFIKAVMTHGEYDKGDWK